jgi:D-alanyl-D-alanine carboxypeptidase
MRRPDPAAEADAIAAITGDVAGLLAELTQEYTQVSDPMRPVARAETVPFQIVQDETPAPTAQEATETVLAEALTAGEPVQAVAAAMQPPRARPEGLAPEQAAQDTAPEEPAVETAQVAVLPEQMAQVPDDTAEPLPLDFAEAEDLPMPRGEEPEALPELVQMTASLRSPETGVSGSNRPSPRPGEIVMTSARMPAADTVPSTTGQVVTRLSTSGGRHWAVNIGSFPNRGAAERALLQTALSETRTLSSALRKVSQRGGKWEANFAGLTQDEADMACRRLQSRAITCFTLGP